MTLDLRGLSPAPVTPFTEDGAVDFAAIQRLGSWLGSIEGVKSLVVLGHAGEGTFLTEEEQLDVIRAFVAYVSRRGFAPFAWYRIVIGAAAVAWLALR